MALRQIFNKAKTKVFASIAATGISIPAFADSPLPISTAEEVQQGQGIFQLFQGILDNEAILFVVIFFAIIICIASLAGMYSAFKRYEEDEKLGKLITNWIASAIFFVLAGAVLYILYQVKSFNG